MAVEYGSGVSKTEKTPLMVSETDHESHEAYLGDRYSQIIQRNLAGRVAPYLPFDKFVKEFEQFSVMDRHTLVTRDENNNWVPANGILTLEDGTNFYEGRPLVYGDADTGGVLTTLNPNNPQQNIHPLDGDLLESGDLNSENVVEVTPDSATSGSVATQAWAAIRSARFPTGVVTDRVMNGAARFQYREQDPQKTLTVLTRYTIMFAEKAANRYNYGQATRTAIILRNALVGSGTDASGGDIALSDLPYWVNQGDTTESNASDNDLILPGDLTACDDWGRIVRFDARVDDWNVPSADTVGDITVNGRYPVAAMHAVVGRCHGREKAVSSPGLSKVRTYGSSTVVGGRNTEMEAVLFRGDAMTSGELSSLQDSMDPGAPQSGISTSFTEWDAEEDAKYGLLIHALI